MGAAARVKLHLLHPAEVAPFVTALSDAARSELGDLSAPHNYVRFLLPARLPATVDRVAYLDSDVIVRSDIAELFDEKRDSLKSPETAFEPRGR